MPCEAVRGFKDEPDALRTRRFFAADGSVARWEGFPTLCAMVGGGSWGFSALLLFCMAPGSATMRQHASTPDLRPSSDGFAFTRDGWKLGIRHIRPGHPDPTKLPVVLCHGLGLNATFWTIADHHLPEQLAARGYEVFIPDLRGSGESAKLGRIGQINARRRQTPLVERGEGRWNIDEVAFNDVPAILDFVKRETGHDRVNWVGHSLGGMLMFPFLERSPESWRIASFVGMGSTVTLADAPQRDMLRPTGGSGSWGASSARGGWAGR